MASLALQLPLAALKLAGIRAEIPGPASSEPLQFGEVRRVGLVLFSLVGAVGHAVHVH